MGRMVKRITTAAVEPTLLAPWIKLAIPSSIVYFAAHDANGRKPSGAAGKSLR
jgi:hypothetical protein